jgi:hypothetical protein
MRTRCCCVVFMRLIGPGDAQLQKSSDAISWRAWIRGWHIHGQLLLAARWRLLCLEQRTQGLCDRGGCFARCLSVPIMMDITPHSFSLDLQTEVVTPSCPHTPSDLNPCCRRRTNQHVKVLVFLGHERQRPFEYRSCETTVAISDGNSTWLDRRVGFYSKEGSARPDCAKAWTARST